MKIFKRKQFRITSAFSILVLGSTFSSLIIGCTYLWFFADFFEEKQLYTYLFVGLLLALFYGISFWFSWDWKLNVSLVTVSVCFTLYISEIFLALTSESTVPIFREHQKSQRIGVEKVGKVAFDGRTKIEVIRALRKSGVVALPNIYPSLFLKSNGLQGWAGEIYPLGGISNSVTVHCNENGRWRVFLSDRYGFSNSAWPYEQGEIDLIVIGDSFAQGACVQPREDIAGQLRQYGIRALTFGANSNGPLMELASLREYGQVLKPKIILWLYYENNDIFNLYQEKKSSILMSYLDENFSQDLIKRQEEIDQVLKSYINEKEKIEMQDNINEGIEPQKGKGYFSNSKFLKVLKLWHFRKRVLPDTLPVPPQLFDKIIDQAKMRVEAWGGALYFVYLPAWDRYNLGRENDGSFRQHDKILSIVRKKNYFDN